LNSNPFLGGKQGVIRKAIRPGSIGPFKANYTIIRACGRNKEVYLAERNIIRSHLTFGLSPSLCEGEGLRDEGESLGL
jgi:hypothetical protein